MGVKTLPRIADALIAGGMSADTPAAAVQWGTHAKQKTVVATLSSLAGAIAREQLAAPVITVIGDVVSLRDEIAWFDRRPLHGRRVVVTRASAQATGLRDALREMGADVLELPALRIEPIGDEQLRGALARLGEFDWIVFTSQNAVRIMWGAIRTQGQDARAFANARIACVGRATGDALLAHGLAPDVVPTRFVAEGVLDAMTSRDDVRGTRVLYVAGEGAREALPAGLRALGCTVEVVHAYRAVSDGTGADALRGALAAGIVDAVTFASASAVRGFVEAVGPELARRAPGVSIGPITSEAVRAAGIELAAECAEPSVAALADAARAFIVSRR